MTAGQSIGLRDLQRLLGDRVFECSIRMRLAASNDNYDDFVECLYEDIDRIFAAFQATPQRRSGDGEDRITDDLVVNLRTAGYDANHDQDAGGHVDVTVKAGNLTWIGEAKIYRSVGNVLEGFLQLTTRYRPASGNFAHNKGGMLIYITEKPNAKAQMDAWRQHIQNQSVDGYQDWDCTRNVLAFHSKHTHEVTGHPFFVRHIPLLLYHQPSDKSARSRKSKTKTTLAD